MKTNLYNPKNLKRTINEYGFKFSYSNYLIDFMFIIVGIIIISSLYGLHKKFIYIISLLLIIMIPSIIDGWFKTSFNIKRFLELSDYLSNAIPLFICKPKINYVLNELQHLTSGKINSLIKQSLKYINETVDDPDLYENGLKIIADEYPNSRVLSLHKFLISVEKSDSSNYKMLADTLYLDIESWIKRVLNYQKELLDKRNKLILLSLSTLIINSVFVYIYRGQVFFKGFVDNEIYQLSTTMFIILISIIINLTINKLSGKWLVDDVDIKDNKEIVKVYKDYKRKDLKIKFKEKSLFILLTAAGTYLHFKNYQRIAYGLFILALAILNYKKLKYKNNFSKLKQYFKMEFPFWIRDVSLLIGNYTVLNAIEESKNHNILPLRKEIDKLLMEARKDPTSIKPYNDFLWEYEIGSSRSSMRVLYSLNGTDNTNVKERLSLLTNRNQEELAKSESLKNKNSMALIDMLGFLPTVLFTMQTIISMVIMFKYVMENLGIDKYL